MRRARKAEGGGPHLQLLTQLLAGLRQQQPPVPRRHETLRDLQRLHVHRRQQPEFAVVQAPPRKERLELGPHHPRHHIQNHPLHALLQRSKAQRGEGREAHGTREITSRTTPDLQAPERAFLPWRGITSTRNKRKRSPGNAMWNLGSSLPPNTLQPVFCSYFQSDPAESSSSSLGDAGRLGTTRSHPFPATHANTAEPEPHAKTAAPPPGPSMPPAPIRRGMLLI